MAERTAGDGAPKVFCYTHLFGGPTNFISMLTIAPGLILTPMPTSAKHTSDPEKMR